MVMTQTGGDKELVLGNKQLISLFFVVVALCGVFFAMGYMIGRNSGKATLSSDAASAVPLPAAGQRQQPEPPREIAASSADPGTPSVQDQPVVSQPQAYQPDTKPAQDTPPARPEPEATPAKEARGGSGVSVAEVGASYLQVTALPRADAAGVVRTLREQSFPAILTASSKDGLFRVLVGPFHGTTALAESKSRLKAMGFGGAIVYKPSADKP